MAAGSKRDKQAVPPERVSCPANTGEAGCVLHGVEGLYGGWQAIRPVPPPAARFRICIMRSVEVD